MTRGASSGTRATDLAGGDAQGDDGETATARTLVLDVPGWPGHLAGQHVDVKLTAEDGYTAQRTYSIVERLGGATTWS